MRRLLLFAVMAGTLILPAVALATSSTASGGGVHATLSYKGSGIQTSDERLTITQSGQPTYDEPVPTKGCFHTCDPGYRRPVQVADVYGDGSEEVVLNLFSGGADCCTVADVYVHSSAVQSWVPTEHNFGEAGFVLKPIGQMGRLLFVSANPAFYCRFTICAGSGLPLQIWMFSEEKFIDVTKQYPKLISADASKWLKLYYKDPKQGSGAIAAAAADYYELGKRYRATINTVLQLQYADHDLTLKFIQGLDRYLDAHYG
jgi:hypothetical protein